VTAEGLTYDTGALVAAERHDRLVWSLHRAALVRGLPPAVPAGVLAEGWRGGPQATLSRFLKGCDVEDLTKEQAREVGALAARAKHDDQVGCSDCTQTMRDHEDCASVGEPLQRGAHVALAFNIQG